MSTSGNVRARTRIQSIAGRIRQVREDLFGDDDIALFLRRVGVPERTWHNYEAGVTIPGDVMLLFLEATSVEPRWLLTGEGPRHRTGLDRGTMA